MWGDMLDFEIIIPYYNGQDSIKRLIESIPDQIRITVVDDISTIKRPDLNYPNVRVIRLARKGYFTGAVNEGIKSTRGDVLILNQDVYFTGDSWLTQLENAVKSGYSYIGERIRGTRKDWPKGYIHGTYMYITREAINKVGLLNERDFPMWGSTAEYQLRVARENLKVLPLTKVSDFVHIREEGESFGDSFQNLLRLEPHNRNLFTTTPPLVSVIIPTHNFSTWLKSTVNSLVGGETDLGDWNQQTFAAFEVIIIDDSSTDDTPEIIKGLVDPWKAVRSIRLNRPMSEVWHDKTNKYMGKVVALNAGIKAAYGKYIVSLDADDMMYEDRLEQLYNAIIVNDNTFVYDDIRTFANGEITKIWHMNDFSFDDCLYKNQVHNSIMFSKSNWKRVGGYPTRFKFGREDWAMNIRLASNGVCGVHLTDYAGLLYRREGQNRTLENTKPKWMDYFRKQMYSEFTSLYEGERPPGCCGSTGTGKSVSYTSDGNWF